MHMDPRIKTPAADLRAQFELETGAVRGMNESFKSLEQVQSVREQLAERSTERWKFAAVGVSFRRAEKNCGT